MLLAPIERPEYADVRREARSLYWRGWGITHIVEELNRIGEGLPGWKPLKRATVESWKQRGKWEEAPSLRAAEEAVAVRFQMLIAKDKKTGGDFKEIDLLGRQIERFERCRKYRDSGNEADLNPNIAARNAKPKKKPRVNQLTAEHVEQLRAAFKTECFAFQLKWWEERNHRTRFILKSRQIGATWYFAREALIDALETGRNQIFLSASRRQAEIFRTYIIEFVFRVTGVQLRGEHLLIDRGDDADGKPLERPTIFFLGANYRTAQGEHGNFCYDECFWAQDFERTDEVASGMASQKRYRETYFSTPSTIAHQAHRKWNGDAFNEGRDKRDWTKIETYHAALKDGALGGDGIWRQIVTIEDAAAGGCDLFDIEELRRRKPPDVFANLYLCEFVDDSQSAFPLKDMQRCRVDPSDKWADFDGYALRPFGEGEVAIGYDPQESAQGDDAALVVMALPGSAKKPFRVLEKLRLRGDFEVQAAAIFKAMARYNVVDIGIDTTGAGAAVYQLVVKRFPLARAIAYSAERKSLMVLKAKNVIRAGRLQYDAGDKDITASFMSIRPELTAKGRQLTYVASRADDTGHADVAWAIMHVLFNEPLDGEAAASQSTMEIF
ncbi:terminase large subunit domain-containing protein [Novosphingopyxis sp. YJ-S2-01]|uniref:terminase large subunit domain-containing protein n=1 Tax=Novosphingopyxis sp. YJ-S2-01 TaxID=2794021 RepID=UPI0018DB7EC9|nr:terminase family protein [Novosphingopyxis sp. YJ-S2-01]MBH9536942.1 terminase [Novosphingopyxis sp. YJ-S2-01]